MQHCLSIISHSPIILILLPCLAAAVNGDVLWRDDFSGTSLNTEYWSWDLGAGGWGNNELQTYTTEAISVTGGLLIIRADERTTGFTSGRIKTDGKIRFRYGTVEARIKIPDVDEGLWPAFWTLGDNFNNVGWPRAGEIDIMEVGQGLAISNNLVNRRVISGAHWENDGKLAADTTWKTFNIDLNESFHIYKLEWTPTSLSTYVDNVKVWEMDIEAASCFGCEEFHRPHFLLLNLAIGGIFTSTEGSGSSSSTGSTSSSGCDTSLSSSGNSSSGGCLQPRIDVSAPLPANMLVDWIQIVDNGHSQVFRNADPVPTPVPTDPVPTPVPTDPLPTPIPTEPRFGLLPIEPPTPAPTSVPTDSQVGPLSTEPPTPRPTPALSRKTSPTPPTPRPTYGISTKYPTRRPSRMGPSTKNPTRRPSGGGLSTKFPTKRPTPNPSVSAPGAIPTPIPSQTPTVAAGTLETATPSMIPSELPSEDTATSSQSPSTTPSDEPDPSLSPSKIPPVTPSQSPSTLIQPEPSSTPSRFPSEQPTITPLVTTPVPSAQPSQAPSVDSACNAQNSPVTYRSANCDNGSQAGYQICLEFLNMPCQDVPIFDRAIAFWESVITSDLSDHVVPSQFLNDNAFCGPGFNPPTPTDDLFICGSYDAIDGAGGVLGTGTSVNDGSGVPKPILWGILKLDTADQARLQNDENLYYDVVLHEIGHVLGIGNNWRLANAPLVNGACEYTGAAATAVYRTLSQCTTGFPLAECTNGHWSEACFDAELMTPSRNFGGILISEMTIASLDDIGYTTDRNAINYDYIIFDIEQSCRCNRRNLRSAVEEEAQVDGDNGIITPSWIVQPAVLPKEKVADRRLYQTVTSEMIEVAWSLVPPVNPIVPAGMNGFDIGTTSTVIFWLLEDDEFYEVSVW
ncbi:unnamed protein product [Cylindrotheca closterium]|uniref:GH16 domain-containing protein n=1 Tax=Cylindrotheca closterium TaxID=2856 RepID=A0AAD2CNJ7_9STRA|nr:unnamed protein product [Cylindrotheca closterium]